ncbi:MAG: hypothetical protein KL863_06560 [Rhizobium sp.]|jgi:hypothetical protein|nr:hypothetical protein [Rhizobium sp.]
MFATHEDLAAAEMNVLESRRKVAVHRQVVAELDRRGQSTRLAEKFLLRLEQALDTHVRERDGLSARMRGELA